jgi:hypothetical protein
VIRVWTGYDHREHEGWARFIRSLIETSKDYRIMPPLSGDQGDGTNSFSIARFRLLEECNWAGPAIFVDAVDMLLRADISELAGYFDKTKAIQVVPHSYKTRHPRKYIGTEMEADNVDYPGKNRSSVMLVNCGHIAHWKAHNDIQAAIKRGDGKYLHRFEWLPENLIGELPVEWNWLCDEYGENENAKLLHWTAGAPFIKHYANAPMAKHWHEEAKTLHSDR